MAKESDKNFDMKPKMFFNFHGAIQQCLYALRYNGEYVEPSRWQGIENPNPTWEILDTSFSVYDFSDNLDRLREQIKPNIPWADDHFEERVSGIALNPGEQYKNWPPYKKDITQDTFRVEGKFTHTYMERYWPKHADGLGNSVLPISGIRFEYGDLDDMVNLLGKDPLTRQAYLPVWFPEDTGVLHGGRVPCSLGYWFINRRDRLNITYYIRSCDAIRHLRDDIYLTVRLLIWVLESLRYKTYWEDIQLGTFTMHIGSLHIFRKELNLIP